MQFLAQNSTPLSEALAGGGGFNIWQSLGGMALVFGLLLVCLKLLGRLNRRHNQGQAGVLAVWPLGPKREVQVVRLANMVHYIYRHDGAMVLLKEETLQQWEAARARDPEDRAMPARMGNLLQALRP